MSAERTPGRTVDNGLRDGAPRADLALAIACDRLVVVGAFADLVVESGAGVADVRTAGQVVTAAVHRYRGGDLDVLVVEHVPGDVGAAALHPVGAKNRKIKLPQPTDDVGELLRHGAAAAEPVVRAELLAFLLYACTSGRNTSHLELDPVLQHNLYLCRQGLRPRLRTGVIDRSAPRAAMIETAVAVDARSMYLRGWIGHGDGELASIVAVGPAGQRIELVDRLVRSVRHDVAALYQEDQDDHGYGFAVYFDTAIHRTSGPARNAAPDWLLEIVPADQPGFEVEVGVTVATYVDDARSILLGDLVIERPGHDLLRTRHISPAITALLARAQRRVTIRHVEQLGTPPRSPDVSVIVPLYKRIDFVEHQLAQFVHDPDLGDADLVYVLDSPELADALLAEAHRWFRFFQVPFRVVVLSQNGGFSTANNLGAEVARGRLLLLMNSDVLPDQPGWLTQLVAFHDDRSDVGAVAPKLVYEDESIQHAGMFFERPEGAELWANEHYYKGLHRSFAAACESRPVPAVSAACMLIDAELYRAHDGLRGVYVQGDFEDSDLCLRLTAAGRTHWYCADVELYHLEGQSYPTPARIQNGAYNKWLHTHQWRREIESTMARYGDAPLLASAG